MSGPWGSTNPPTGGNYHGIVLRYDGTAWHPVSRTGSPGNERLRGVDAISAADVWAVGDNRGAAIGRHDTLAAHWNGTSWTRESTPDGNFTSINSLSGVAATGSTVWAVGSQTSDIQSVPPAPLVLHWNGSGWVSMDLRAPTGTALNGVDARTSGDVWVVGSTSDTTGTQSYIAHFDGSSWHRVATPSAASGGQLSDVVAPSSSSAFAVGRSNGSPLVLRWDGTSWTRETTSTVSSNPYLTAAAAGGPGAIWAIGYRFEFNAYANRTLAMLGS